MHEITYLFKVFYCYKFLFKSILLRILDSNFYFGRISDINDIICGDGVDYGLIGICIRYKICDDFLTVCSQKSCVVDC